MLFQVCYRARTSGPWICRCPWVATPKRGHHSVHGTEFFCESVVRTSVELPTRIYVLGDRANASRKMARGLTEERGYGEAHFNPEIDHLWGHRATDSVRQVASAKVDAGGKLKDKDTVITGLTIAHSYGCC